MQEREGLAGKVGKPSTHSSIANKKGLVAGVEAYPALTDKEHPQAHVSATTVP
jgi:hypothetical protein